MPRSIASPERSASEINKVRPAEAGWKTDMKNTEKFIWEELP